MAGDKASQIQLILTPALLESIHDTLLPPPGASAEEFFHQYNSEKRSEVLAKKLYQSTFHSTFVPLSQIPLYDYPSDLMELLPDPHDSDFPICALGLLLLFDQVSRRILKKHNQRWGYEFFDKLALRLAEKLEELPAETRIDNVERWFAANPVFTWADAMLRRSLVVLPFEHSENIDCQRHGSQVQEDIRQKVEAHFGRADPSRADQRVEVADVAALPRLVSQPIPPVYLTADEHADYFFFQCILSRYHTPVLERFKRYPWRNGSLGREDTEEETEYLRSIDNFNPVDPQVAMNIRKDIEAGVFRPLYDLHL